jgi:putative ATPase
MGMMKRSGKESKTTINRDSSCLVDDGGMPLAARMRPRTLEQFIGQPHILGEGKLLRRAIEADRVTSVIFWGPPGTGKTTLARVIANATQSKFETINAVLAGVKDIREVVASAAERLKKNSFEDSQRTILFVDEVHRFNKAQQDALLPHVENGTITFIGATTENPYFSVIKALVSRSTIFELRSLADDELREILLAALDDCERGYGELNHEVAEDALDHIVQLASGDARNALNALELALVTTPPDEDGVARVGLEVAEESIQQRALLYDKDGDIHYDMISAFIKSLRGTDPDAALYWMARMIRAGEDPLFIARRMVIFASEDIGMADPLALVVANNAAEATRFVGLPECQFSLSQACIHLATAPKSNSTMAYYEAVAAVNNGADDEVPNHLKDSSRDKEGLGHGKNYKYPHAFREHWVAQQYLPDGLQGNYFYKPGDQGFEKKVRERIEWLRQEQEKGVGGDGDGTGGN